MKQKVHKQRSINQIIDDELRTYKRIFKRETKIPSEGDPLQWWNARKVSIPHLYQRALRLLHIPATYVSSYKVFSIAGNVVYLKRTSPTLIM